MPTDIWTAIIALVGVALSTAISFFLGRRQAAVEIDKLRIDLQSSLGGKLYERRLQVYPELYEQLSGLIKELEANRVSRSTLEAASARIAAWDTRFSIFFGSVAGSTCHALRKRLIELVEQTDEHVAAQMSDENERQRLRREIQEMELALKHELGTYHFESPIAPRVFRLARKYSELNRELEVFKS